MSVSRSDATTPVGRRGLRSASHPAILALAAAGVLSILSDTRRLDGIVLVALAISLAWDLARRPFPSPSMPVNQVARRALPGGTRNDVVARFGCATVFCASIAAFPRYSWPATAAIWALAAVGVTAVWMAPDRSAPAGLRTWGVLAWAGVAVAGGAWELAALAQQPNLLVGSWDHPTFSVLADPVLASYPGRAAVLAAWLALGWYLLHRVFR